MKTKILFGLLILIPMLILCTAQKSGASEPITTATIEQLLNTVEEGSDIEIRIMPPMDEVYPHVKSRDCEVKDGFLVINAYGGAIYLPISNLLTIRTLTSDDGTILMLRFWFR
jgi:hypothetical protein